MWEAKRFQEQPAEKMMAHYGVYSYASVTLGLERDNRTHYHRQLTTNGARCAIDVMIRKGACDRTRDDEGGKHNCDVNECEDRRVEHVRDRAILSPS